MFCLSLLEHTFRLPAELVALPLPQSIRGELEKLFLDKVIPNLGLCISVYDIRSIEGGLIWPGEGSPTYKVTFRLVMFRPFMGEILVGNVKRLDKDGLQVSLGFFEDVHIPANLFPQPSRFMEDGTWEWDWDGNEQYIYHFEKIRFRVHTVEYPTIPIDQKANAKPFAPMEIIGTIHDDGLGPVSWWED
ncbi:hypothetical protein AMTRI_Chr03g147720 [Amborella trichopoda]|uniref:DNA-directed RNA polymerase III subunit RPC8 isoform X2 n=1 Tax=Amborella trichopoda TaxID=13333 RepID=UPI0005D42198|nr:DNA-directed RNA polymerase III subunit RPC8 isoform X2 [Amborella trichopoda]|eukprot:XP_011621603.1 DNA-directed RNA polymerase III subunit RPC8 isoform X2 [Amborella trichopoda]